jgi:hypothetical protein
MSIRENRFYIVFLKDISLRTLIFDCFYKKIHHNCCTIDFNKVSNLKIIEFQSQQDEDKPIKYYGIFLSDRIGLLFNTYFEHSLDNLRKFAFFLHQKIEEIIEHEIEFEVERNGNEGSSNIIVRS